MSRSDLPPQFQQSRSAVDSAPAPRVKAQPREPYDPADVAAVKARSAEIQAGILAFEAALTAVIDEHMPRLLEQHRLCHLALQQTGGGLAPSVPGQTELAAVIRRALGKHGMA